MVAQRKDLLVSQSNVYVGIDVHKDKWVVSVIQDDELRKPISISGNAEQLKTFLKPYKELGVVHCVYEAGFSGFWLARELQAWGVNCEVVHPADIPTTDFERRRKTDEIDSSKLAVCLRRSLLNGIHIPSVEREELRSLLRARHSVSKDRRRIMCRIRSLLNFSGIKPPKALDRCLWTRQGLAWLKEKSQEHSGLEVYVEQYELINELLKRAGRKLVKAIRASSYKDLYTTLLTAPGIGWVTAATLICEIGEFDRFKGIDQLSSYCGLVPDVRSSAQTKKVLGISQRRNRYLRSILVEAAWVAKRYNPILGNTYSEAIRQGKPPQKAIIKVARKFLNHIRAIALSNSAYQMKTQEEN